MSRGQHFGPYRLEELIGRGGMGEVYRAYDTRRDRVVALKILPTAMAAEPQFEARFRREAQLVARLSAPHIIPIHDFGEIEGRLYLDMRLVRGVDLATVLESGPLTPGRAVEMISQVASALDAAHADGLVHRDVKPSNVLYVGDPRGRLPDADDADFVYLVDFGIARSLEATDGPTLTATGHAVGTLGYMAPERFSGERADRRVDVYALACTLYEALTGRPAFAGDALAAMMYAHLQRMPPPASTVARGVPPALDAVLATGLAKRPEERHPSAGALAEAARSALRGLPAPRRPAPTRPGLTVPVAPDPRPGRPLPSAGPAPRRAPLGGHPGPFPMAAGSRAAGPGRRRAWQVGGAAVAATALAAGVVVGVQALRGTEPGPAQSNSLVACDTNPLSCNDAPADQLVAGGKVVLAIEADIEDWNVASLGGFGPAAWALGSVLPHTFTVEPDMSLRLEENLLAGADLIDPTTVVYRIRSGAVWSDGTPVSADDFVLNWRIRNGRDCPDCSVDTTGYELISGITGTPNPDGGSTVTVRLRRPHPDWRTLFASTAPLYPAHVAAGQGDPGTPAGLKAAFDFFSAAPPTYSAGPLLVRDWQPGRQLVLERNPQWYGRPARLDRVELQVLTDPEAQLGALRAGRIQMIVPTGASSERLRLLGGLPDVGVYQGPGQSWERLDVNVRAAPLAEPALRRALFTAIDLSRIRTIGADAYGRAEPMNSHTFVPEQPAFTDVLTGSGQGTGDVDAARDILAAAGYRGIGTALATPDGRPVPPLRVSYPSANQARQRCAEYLSELGRRLGLTITPTPTDSLGTLTAGDFDLFLSGWGVSPAPIADAGQNWTSEGTGNYNGYANPAVDQLLAQAGAQPDLDAAYDLLTQADRQLTADAVVLPLYRRPTLLAVRRELANVRDNPASGPLYNVVDWGLRGT
ncbi:MAG TPA: ABC transporter substrate-binding protein [Pseudonocardia sp.]|nr:ABC transporter substrate-binding protein [Pseudonocardia sp.]